MLVAIISRRVLVLKDMERVQCFEKEVQIIVWGIQVLVPGKLAFLRNCFLIFGP